MGSRGLFILVQLVILALLVLLDDYYFLSSI